MTKTKIAAVPTHELLQELNADKAAAAAEMAPPVVVPSDHITLSAGPLKVIFLRPSRITETRFRAGRGKPVPAFMAYVQNPEGKCASYEAFSFSGPEVEPRVNLASGKLPYEWMPTRIPGTSGTDASDVLTGLDWWHETTGELVIYSEPRSTFVVPWSRRPAEEVKVEPLPEIPHFAIATPRIATFLEACEDFIVAAHASGKGRSVGAAHSLCEVARNLFVVDQLPKAKPFKPGDDVLKNSAGAGPVDSYPDGSAIVRAHNESDMPTPSISAGYVAALDLLGSRAMDRDKRDTCERAAHFLMELRDALRTLKT